MGMKCETHNVPIVAVPKNVFVLQWWTFALRSRHEQLRHGMDNAAMFYSNANSEYTSCIQNELD